MCVCACVHAQICLEVKGQLKELAVFFHHVDLGNELRVSGLAVSAFDLLSF